MSKLEDNRKKINLLDRELVEILENRMKCVAKIAEEKSKTTKNIYDAEREKKVIANVLSVVSDDNMKEYIIDFFKDVMEISKKYQKDISKTGEPKVLLDIEKGKKAGYQGAEGSYTEQAFRWVFGENSDAVSYQKLEELFDAISKGKVVSGVVPYENSSTGGVNSVTDMMRKYDLYIKAETEVRIEHCLLGVRGSLLRDIKYAYSHTQALQQCSGFFRINTDITECTYANTAFAARDTAKWGEKEKAAIASKRCADLYGLDIIRENIQDSSRNKTRFIVISADPNPAEGAVKTSIIFTSNHTPGALYKVLEPFYENKINITRIESRPNPRRSFEYYFYLDFNGSTADQIISSTLEVARKSCGYFRVLGSYSSI